MESYSSPLRSYAGHLQNIAGRTVTAVSQRARQNARATTHSGRGTVAGPWSAAPGVIPTLPSVARNPDIGSVAVAQGPNAGDFLARASASIFSFSPSVPVIPQGSDTAVHTAAAASTVVPPVMTPMQLQSAPPPAARAAVLPQVEAAPAPSVAPIEQSVSAAASGEMLTSVASADWRESWTSAAAMTPCGSCTGRACTMCSIRTGGPAAANGKPSGYAPRTLIYYQPEELDAAKAVSAPAMSFAASNVVAADAMTFAATATNAIVLENLKQGTPESVWMIGTADPTIEGFAVQFTINHGNTVDFKINTNSRDYTIDIYRLGYYGGDGARKVATIERDLTTAQLQPTPIHDPTTNLVDAGNWSVSASWAIPQDAVSGIYFAKLTRHDGSGGENMIPFIVRDDEAPSDITFQTSDTTWQAYNWWGGYNLYGGVDAGGHAGRATKVSYNRPIITRDGGFSAGPQDFIFGAEYAAIRFLEQNGYDVNYISGIDTARTPSQLLNSKVFLSVGHDEYWSGEQRANVEAARDAGVNLQFWSGNEVYWETRWEASIDGTGTPYKTLVSYKERWDNANTDTQGTTSTWRDPVFGSGEPENALTGTMFTVDSYRLDAITVPYEMSNLRFWTNTAVADLQPGQVYTLTQNLLGYEWNSDLDNGFRPAGLVPLSSTTLDVNTKLLDYGNVVGPGTATHSLTLYRAPSGALVFGAGTVYWSWGLDSHHDNEATPTDRNVQQAMINLFAEMGVQPTTLMQSLVVASQSTDHTAPTTTIISPTASGSLTAAQTYTITGTAADAGGGLVAVVEVSTDGGVSWHRATGYNNWTYSWTPLVGGTYTIRSRAVDDSVNLETPSAGVTVNVAQGGAGSLFAPSATPAVPFDDDPTPVTVGVRFSSTQSGSILGVRYYKGSGNTGEHIGSLWTSTGTLLASATFTNETVSGWQTVIFDNPISITAGTTYVAGFHGSQGYAVSPDYYATARTNGALTATSGLFTYSAAISAPTVQSSASYWVDVVFSGVETPNQAPVGANDNGYLVQRNTTITFSFAELLANDTDPNNDILTLVGAGAASGGTVAFNAQQQTLTFTPNTGYLGPASFGYSISDGRGGTGSAFVNMEVVPQVSTTSLFSTSDTPANLAASDNARVNLGMRFTAAASGMITGMRYYKGAGDTGVHVGSLWSSTGVLLASATFVNETASGWQSVNFSSPVAVSAGTTYVVSYLSNGSYTSTPNYFVTDRSNGYLTAPAGSNGVYTYGSASVMPTSTFNNTNYWVDVLLTSTAAANRPPVAVNDSGYTTPNGTALTLTAAALLANDNDPDSNPLSVTGVSGAVNGTATFNAQTNTIVFTPTTGYSGPASFTYAISDGLGGTASATVSLTVGAPPNRPPVATNDNGYYVQTGSTLQLAASVLLANDSDPDGDPLTITGVSGATNGTVGFNAQTNTITFTPAAGYTGGAGFTYTVIDGRGGTATASVALTVAAKPAGSTLFAANAAPAVTNTSDNGSVELGMKFTVTADGTITGMRFYKGAQNTGTHTGTLWTSTGTQLATLVFTNETASGWQSASFSSPIAVTAGTSYVISYHAPNGHYSSTSNYFASTGVTNGALSAPSTTAGGGNGVYTYGAATAFPTSTYSATNYWVDVYYQGTSNSAPVANNDAGLTAQRNTPVQIAAATLLANDTDANGDILSITGVSGATNGAVSLDAQNQLVTFTPTANYTGPASFSYTISDGRGGSATASASLTVSAPAAGVSLFAANATPATANVNDSGSVELGMKFTSSQSGTVTGIRFYKGSQNTGTHTGTLWSASGANLGTLTFQNETASGWQTATFATPIAITAGSTYVVSYHAPNGHYSATANGFASAVTSGPLTAPSSSSSGGNGVYAYGSASAFPSGSFNATNYYVDVIFNGSLAS